MTSQAGSHGAAGPASGHDEGSTGNTSGAGFKVYGSVFKTDPRYEFLNPLGKGSYGIVCAARDRDTGQRLAIKKVCPMAKRTVDAKHTLREVLLLQLLGKHPNIISIHNLSTNLKDDELYIMMDLMDTDMHRVIQSSQTLSESHVKYFLHQLLRGVKYLHDNGVLHRDLKPGNLLLTKTCQLKIADFGLARKTQRFSSGAHGMAGLERPRSAPAMSHGSSSSASSSSTKDRAPLTEHVVTRWYRAPELMLQPDGFYDESVDMWSVGCIFAEILGRKALFPGKNFLHQLTLIFDIIGTPPVEATARIKSSQAQRFLKSLGKKVRVPFRTVFPTASDEALDLLERLLEFDPEKRISAQEALAHPFMQPIERKYKGVDPHPSARVDFSFDSKKLTKMDLRALIIKEVESFRRSVAHTAAIDADLTAETTLENSSAVAPSIAKSTSTHSERDTAKPRPASASAAAVSSSGRVMCGSAGISMIHSTMRQRLDTDLTSKSDASSSTIRPSSAAPISHVSATIGSNRQRIRVNTKPPVPRQPPGQPTGIAASDPQGLVRVVAVQDAKSLLSSIAAMKQDETQPRQENHASEEVSESSSKKVDATAAFASRPETTRSIPQPPVSLAPRNASTDSDNHSNNPTAKAAAVTAFSTFEQRSKVLMATSAADATWAAPVASLHVSKVTSSRPEVSHSPSPPRSPASASSSSSDKDSVGDRSQHIASVMKRPGHLTDRGDVSEPAHSEMPRRRVASAGPIRSKPAIAIASVQKTQLKQGVTPTTFVGSTTSLIRAQRSSNGKSLADSADQVVAKMTTRHDMGQMHDQRVTREPRDESCLEGNEPTLKPQRSTTQLNQLETTTKKPTRKLTVPKSPKFSVMSWQKKKELRAAKVTSSAIDPAGGYVVSRRL